MASHSAPTAASGAALTSDQSLLRKRQAVLLSQLAAVVVVGIVGRVIGGFLAFKGYSNKLPRSGRVLSFNRQSDQGALLHAGA
jgi:hypothetical protein